MKTLSCGITVNEAALGSGIMDVILEAGKEAPLSLGMLPADIMQAAADQFERKVRGIMRAKYGEEYEKFFDVETPVKQVVAEFSRILAVAVLSEAKKLGIMAV